MRHITVGFSIALFLFGTYFLNTFPTSPKDSNLFKSTMKKICNRDLFNETLTLLNDGENPDQQRHLFYKLMGKPSPQFCKIKTPIGGIHFGDLCWDGVKYVCLDDIPPKGCVVYSFGISRDTTFERQMVSLNCLVYGYDHTIGIPPEGKLIVPGLTVYGLALGPSTEGNRITFKDAMASHGHLKTTITYLKVDIEGHEVQAFQNWIETNALDNVKQIGMEMHTKRNITAFIDMVKTLDTLGFKPISYDANSCKGLLDGIFTLFEVVFRRATDKENLCNAFVDGSSREMFS